LFLGITCQPILPGCVVINANSFLLANNKQESKMYFKLMITSVVLIAGIYTGAVSADSGDRLAHHWDRKGDLIENRLDHKGDRIDARLDRRSQRVENLGYDKLAARLDRKGDRIDAKLDRHGFRLDHKMDRRGQRLARRYDRRHAE
jgi:hypothetical protein